MGFFYYGETHTKKSALGSKSKNIKLLHRMECKLCPLNNARVLNPKMEPTGSDKPLILILGEAPGKDEDKRAVQFVGRSGKILRDRIPNSMLDRMRFDNCIRTRPPGNRDPAPVEIECCRPRHISDIEQTKPKAIFGFGNVPLQWALGYTGITKWRGRRIPVKIGDHCCWYYPMYHPSHISRSRKFTPAKKTEYGSEEEFVFALDLARACAEVDNGLPEPIVHTAEVATTGVDCVTEFNRKSVIRIGDFLESLYDTGVVGLDYETNALQPYGKGAKILTVALSTKGQSFSFPLRHSKSKWSTDQLNEVEKLYRRFLTHAKCTKAVHHVAFEMEWSGFFFGWDVIRSGEWDCTLSQAFILDEQGGRGSPGAHSLEFLCIQYFGINIKELAGVDVKNLDRTPLPKVLKYNAVDAKYHRLLYLKQLKRLRTEGLVGVYQDHMQRPSTMVLTQLQGVPVHQQTVQRFYDNYTSKLSNIETDIFSMSAIKKFKQVTGGDFRPSAPKDVKILFRDILKLKQFDNGDLNVDENVLKKIKHPAARQVLRWRKLNKTRSTYIVPLMKESPKVYAGGTIIHPTISTTRTRTWRTSMDGPNMQNQPQKSDEAKKTRAQIKALANHRIVSFDYGQIQARNIAMESLDEELVDAFWEQYDVHSDWMYKIQEAYPKWFPTKKLSDSGVVAKYRQRTKNEFVFPSFFGAYHDSIAASLGVPKIVVQDLQEELWTMFPGVKGWHDRLFKFYRKHGYVTGHSGFRRRAPISRNKLINSPIQADEALIVCDAMARLSELDHDNYQACLEIHDDLTFHWHKKEVDEHAEVVVREMLDVPFKWAHVVPIVVDMSVGRDWYNMEKVDTFSSDVVLGRKR